MKHTQQIGRLIEAELFSTLKQDRFCKGDQGNSRIQHMPHMPSQGKPKLLSFSFFSQKTTHGFEMYPDGRWDHKVCRACRVRKAC